MHIDTSISEFNREQKLPPNEESALQTLFTAYEKFNNPSHHTSHESLSSLSSSTNSSCSDFSELITQDASFQAKLYHALQRVATRVQLPSRLPFAPREAMQPSELSFEDLGMLKKILVAFDTFVNPPTDGSEDGDVSFPRVC